MIQPEDCGPSARAGRPSLTPTTFCRGRLGCKRPNGTTTSYSYDDIHRLTRLLHADSQGRQIEGFHYAYDGDSRIASISSIASSSPLPAASSFATADAANRIAQAGMSSFSFDNQGQPTS